MTSLSSYRGCVPPATLSSPKNSRNAEKKQLGQLNNRLAAYIERVRDLELENGRLENQVSSIEETRSREVTSVRGMYDKELGHARRALDETARDKAKFEIEAERLKTNNMELNAKLAEKSADSDRLEEALNSLVNQLTEAKKKVETVVSDRHRLADELKTMRPDFNNMQNKLADAKKNLEDETLIRIDLQNQLQTLKEEHKFESSFLEQQLHETRTRNQLEIEEVDGRVSQQYEQKLQSSLQELRDAYEQQMAENKAGFSSVYDKRIQDLQAKLAAERGSAAGAVQEMKEMMTRSEGMSSRVRELEVNNDALQDRLEGLQEQLDAEGLQNRAYMARKDHDIDFLTEQHTGLTQEYQDLLEIKIALDMEIAAYRALLEGEESRLGMSQSEGPSYRSEAGRSKKRKRMVQEEEEYSGTSILQEFTQPMDFFIEPLDEELKCIKVTNKGHEQGNLGGCMLSCTSGGLETIYPFPRTVKVEAGAFVSVWSSDVGVEHKPKEGQYVMKEGAWKMGDETVTVLYGKEGEVVATRDTVGEKVSSRSSRREALFAQPGVEDKNCVIM